MVEEGKSNGVMRLLMWMAYCIHTVTITGTSALGPTSRMAYFTAYTDFLLKDIFLANLAIEVRH